MKEVHGCFLLLMLMISRLLTTYLIWCTFKSIKAIVPVHWMPISLTYSWEFIKSCGSNSSRHAWNFFQENLTFRFFLWENLGVLAASIRCYFCHCSLFDLGQRFWSNNGWLAETSSRQMLKTTAPFRSDIFSIYWWMHKQPEQGGIITVCTVTHRPLTTRLIYSHFCSNHKWKPGSSASSFSSFSNLNL